MKRSAELVARAAVACAAACGAGCGPVGTRDWLSIAAVRVATTSTPPGCDGPITRSDDVDVTLTRDDRFGAAEVRVRGTTAIGSPCHLSVHLGYVKRDTTSGPFTWAAEARNLLVDGAPEGAPPAGTPGAALELGRPIRAAIPPAGAALHPLTLAAGDAVTLAASGDGAAAVGVWLRGIALPWARAPGLPTQEFFVAPVAATYTVRVAGEVGKAYVVFAVHGGSSGTTADDAPPDAASP